MLYFIVFLSLPFGYILVFLSSFLFLDSSLLLSSLAALLPLSLVTLNIFSFLQGRMPWGEKHLLCQGSFSFSNTHSIKYCFSQRDDKLNFFSTNKQPLRLCHLEGTGFLFFPAFLLWMCPYKILAFLSGIREALTYTGFVAAALENGNICFIITTWEPPSDFWLKAGSLLRKEQKLNNVLARFLLLKLSSLIQELRNCLWLSIPQTSTAPSSYKNMFRAQPLQKTMSQLVFLFVKSLLTKQCLHYKSWVDHPQIWLHFSWTSVEN